MTPFTPTNLVALDVLLNHVCDRLREFQVRFSMEHPERNVTVTLMNEQLSQCWQETIAPLTATFGEKVLQKARKEISSWLPTLTVVRNTVARKNADEPQRNWVTEEVRAKRYYWKLLEYKMRAGLDKDSCAQIDNESEDILRLLPNPMEVSSWHSFGLVVGQVQSGKTSNYSALISKAADAGYRMIVILAGIHDDLRNQTQERLDEDFIGGHLFCDPDDEEQLAQGGGIRAGVGFINELFDPRLMPRRGTYTNEDFRGCTVNPEDLPWLFVVKKNRAVLERLNKWAINSGVGDRWPLLVIDDEADQASINTARSPNLATSINRQIRKLIQGFRRACYVGYTATPFANIMIDSEVTTKKLGQDLFPRDFIFHMKPSWKYYGPTVYFGAEFENTLDVFMPFGYDHALEWISNLRKQSDVAAEEMPVEVRAALMQFLLSCGIRLWRECRKKTEEQLSASPLKTSMLVHVTHLVREQRLVLRGVRSLVEELRSLLLYDPDIFFEELEPAWDAQRNEVTPAIRERRSVDTGFDDPEDWILPNSLDDLCPYIEEVLLTLEVHLVNGEAKHSVGVPRDSSAPQEPRIEPVLFIGGNKLSRGLTLPGLCMSVFLRGSTMYDTLLQMGRWFGYRNGYADLCRISTTNHMIERFRAITEATVDLERQIRDMNVNERTPDKYRLTVLAHPGLQITARNKMRTAVESEHYFNGVVVENRSFTLSKGGRPLYAEQCIRPAYDLMHALDREGKLVYADKSFKKTGLPENRINFRQEGEQGISRSEGRLWRKVPAETILSFLERFAGGRQDLVSAIRERNKKGQLVDWTVYVPGVFDESNAHFKSKPVERSKMKLTAGKSELSLEMPILLGGGHNYCGVSKELILKTQNSISEREQRGEDTRGLFFTELRRIAGQEEPETGHFILYQINPSEEVSALPAFTDDAYGTGKRLPLCTFYLWLPRMPDEHGATRGLGNRTVPIFAVDDDFGEETEDDKEDL